MTLTYLTVFISYNLHLISDKCVINYKTGCAKYVPIYSIYLSIYVYIICIIHNEEGWMSYSKSSLGALKNTDLGNQPQTWELLWKSRISEVPIHHWSKKKLRLDSFERAKGTIWSSAPREHGGWEPNELVCAYECWASPSIWDAV